MPRLPREEYGTVDERGHQLADLLRRRLWWYIEGSRLPGERELSERFKVSLRVARRAVELLSEQGLVTSSPGRGSVLAFEHAAPIPIRRVVATHSGLPHGAALDQPILQAIGEECNRLGLEFATVDASRVRISRPESLLSVVRAGAHETGMVLVRFTPDEPILRTWWLWHVPIVHVGQSCSTPIPTVTSDATGAAHQAVNRLAMLGHRRIGYLAPPDEQDSASPADRLEGFMLAMARHELPTDPSMQWQLAPTPEAIPLLCQRLADEHRPTAIVTADPRLGCALLRACELTGLSVPSDLSVISTGLDELVSPFAPIERLSRYSEGSLRMLGRIATEQLLHIVPLRQPVRTIVQRANWIDGGSVAPPASGPGSVKTDAPALAVTAKASGPTN